MTRLIVCFPSPPSVCQSADRCVAGEELSEEDQQLKNELDMLVERLTVSTKLRMASHDF